MTEVQNVVAYRYFLFLFFVLLLPDDSSAQSVNGREPIPNLYIDCRSCDITYIRTNVTFINYVRDQGDADIYLLINDLRTAGGGREFTMIFSGMGPESSRSDTLRYVSQSTDSGDERRRGLVRYIKIGLIPFLTQTAAIENIDIFYEEDEDDAETTEDGFEDPWNNWVFDIDARSWMSGEKTEKDFSFFGGVYANRITPEWKIRIRARGEIEQNRVQLSDGLRISNRNWGDIWSLVAYSLTEHLSAGVYTRINTSTFNNIKMQASISPALEYNVFPYEEYNERRFLIRYTVSPSYRNYFDTTIFDKEKETLMRQSLSFEIEYDRRWGRFRNNISGSHFFHDTSLNRLNFNTSLDVRIVKGFSLSISGRYSLINDQIALRAGDATDEEVLLGLQQQATSYSYGLSLGLSYTFGSIYNNVVNPRF